MKALFTIVLALSLCCFFADPGFCQNVKRDYPLPETICILDVTAEGKTFFGNRFCWVGDQNGDGFDDLLVSHDPYQPRPPHSNTNQVELYYGGSPMSTHPGFIFQIDGDGNGIGSAVNYIGRFISNSPPVIGIQTHYWPQKASWPDTIRTSLYLGGRQLDDLPDYTISRDYSHQIFIPREGHRLRPFDFNGDGFDDLVGLENLGPSGRIVPNGKVNIYFGGIDFDTIPDWSVWIESGNFTEFTEFSTGYDINSDGFDDLLVRYEKYTGNYTTTISLFLGGPDPDTIPTCTWDDRTYSQQYSYALEGFSLLPDINGDGYDDWAISYCVSGTNDGTFVFFGGDPPDSVYDVSLPRHGGIIMDNQPDVTGGDFNGDGYGDIVTSNDGANYEEGGGEVDIFFGSLGWVQPKKADIIIEGTNQYGKEFQAFGQYVGAVGDYNGDGTQDFVVRVAGDDGDQSPKMVILAGNQGWKVNVDSPSLPIRQQLGLFAYPNPINNEAIVGFSVTKWGNVSLGVFDLHGRKVAELFQGATNAGEHQITWRTTDVPTGIYFIRIHTGSGEFTATKIVVLK